MAAARSLQRIFPRCRRTTRLRAREYFRHHHSPKRARGDGVRRHRAAERRARASRRRPRAARGAASPAPAGTRPKCPSRWRFPDAFPASDTGKQDTCPRERGRLFPAETRGPLPRVLGSRRERQRAAGLCALRRHGVVSLPRVPGLGRALSRRLPREEPRRPPIGRRHQLDRARAHGGLAPLRGHGDTTRGQESEPPSFTRERALDRDVRPRRQRLGAGQGPERQGQVERRLETEGRARVDRRRQLGARRGGGSQARTRVSQVFR